MHLIMGVHIQNRTSIAQVTSCHGEALLAVRALLHLAARADVPHRLEGAAGSGPRSAPAALASERGGWMRSEALIGLRFLGSSFFELKVLDASSSSLPSVLTLDEELPVERFRASRVFRGDSISVNTTLRRLLSVCDADPAAGQPAFRRAVQHSSTRKPHRSMTSSRDAGLPVLRR